MKLIYVILIVILTTNTVKSQFYAELGSGYAFSTKKQITKFYEYNYFKRIHNLFTGVFYKGNLGYVFKINIGAELNCEYNPTPTDILNNPKSITNSFLNFYDGSYLSVIPRITYQYKIKKINLSLGIGIGYNMLNYYLYHHLQTKSSSSTDGYIISSYSENTSTLYKYTEEQYRFNINFKVNYKISKLFSVFFEANANSSYSLNHGQDFKIIYNKSHIETYSIYNNPQTTISDINEKNINVNRSFVFNYYDKEIYKVADISKLIYTQIGLRYTFGKKDVKE